MSSRQTAVSASPFATGAQGVSRGAPDLVSTNASLDGLFESLSGVIHDLLERKQILDTLVEREAQLRLILDLVPDAIVVADDGGFIESLNASASRLFGYGASETAGMHVRELFAGLYRDNLERQLGMSAPGAGAQAARGHLVLGSRRDGNTFPMEVAFGEVRLGQRRILAAFMRDLSERQGIELRMRELQSELLHASRLSAMGEMTAALAHELNQPLGAIMNYVGAAKKALSSGSECAVRIDELIECVAQEAIRAGDIIRNLRGFVEKRESRRAAEDFNGLVKQSVAFAFVGASDLNIKVRLELDPDLGNVTIDRIQIQQVLINLIRNSIDAMRAVPVRELTVTTRRDDTAHDVTVRVQDTGPGISTAVAGRLFQPFTTTKAGGMGIGLTICRSIIEAHRGRIGASAEREVGAEFYFVLPLDGDMAATA